MSDKIDFRVIYLRENMGHGNARRVGLDNCRNNLVALMDADDISVPNRFEKQLRLFKKLTQLSIVGGQISEFSGEPNNIIGIRRVPIEDAAIKEYMKKRCPMNQMSVMFKKDEVERAGGYIDWYCEEDYYLWARMALDGCVFANVDEILVNVRAGNEMSARRGGMKYFRSEARMQRFLFSKKIIPTSTYIYNLLIRFGGEVLAPNFIRVRLFRLFRKQQSINVNFLSDNDEKEKENTYFPFSVSMCVYGGDNAKWFDTAMSSVIHQTIRPQEIVLVVDGAIPSGIREVIDKYTRICK